MTPDTTLVHDGIEQSITEWALDYGITPAIIIARLERGISTADAITKPMRLGFRGQRLPVFSTRSCGAATRKITHEVNGVAKTMTEWAEHIGITRSALACRLRSMPIEKAIALKPQRRPKDRQHPPGVVSNFEPSEGTGAGSTAQETPNITFSQEAAE